MRGRGMGGCGTCGYGMAGLLRHPCARWRRNAELGKRAGQLRPAAEPAGDGQGSPEPVLAWWRVDDRPAGRPRVDVLADLPDLLARPRYHAGHRIDDQVPRAEGGRRRGGAQPGRIRSADAGPGAEHYGEQTGLLGQAREPALLSWLAG